MATAIIDGIGTRYEVLGNGPPLLMYAPGVPQPSWALGDFDYNGFVDDDDVTLLGVFYDPNASPLITSAAAPPNANTVAAVPEPGSLLLAIIAAATALALRNRR